MAGRPRIEQDVPHSEGCQAEGYEQPWWLTGRSLQDLRGRWLVADCNDATCPAIALVSLDDIEEQLSRASSRQAAQAAS